MPNAQSAQSNHATQSLQAELLDIFGHIQRQSSSSKDKASSQRKLAARRAIEQHFERRELEKQISDCWVDD